MSRSTTNVPLMPAPGNWQSGQEYGAYDSNNSYWNMMHPRPPSTGPLNVRGTLPVEEIVRTGSSGLTSVSAPPYSPTYVLFLDDINPNPGQSIMQDKQKKASNKLRKGIYIPTLRRRWKSLNLYYRDYARSILNEKDQKEEDNDYYRCPICLEDFEPRQEVMVTPCSHVFHGECIVPWVKSSSRCPVCRFAIPL